jgi:hypothetical protein
MRFESLLVENAGTSGEIITKRPDVKEKVRMLALRISQ